MDRQKERKLDRVIDSSFSGVCQDKYTIYIYLYRDEFPWYLLIKVSSYYYFIDDQRSTPTACEQAYRFHVPNKTSSDCIQRQINHFAKRNDKRVIAESDVAFSSGIAFTYYNKEGQFRMMVPKVAKHINALKGRELGERLSVWLREGGREVS